MLSEGIVYTTAILPSPAPCCLGASDQQAQSVPVKISLGGCGTTYTAVVWPPQLSGDILQLKAL